jgi:hypothetical protein
LDQRSLEHLEVMSNFVVLPFFSAIAAESLLGNLSDGKRKNEKDGTSYGLRYEIVNMETIV